MPSTVLSEALELFLGNLSQSRLSPNSIVPEKFRGTLRSFGKVRGNDAPKIGKRLNLSARTRHARVSLHLDVNVTPPWDFSEDQTEEEGCRHGRNRIASLIIAPTNRGTSNRERSSAQWNAFPRFFPLARIQISHRRELIFKYATSLPQE